jgi:hypothetical protein
MFETKIEQKKSKHISCSIFLFFSENRAVCEIMWGKNIVQPYRLQMTIWRLRLACCVTKATDYRHILRIGDNFLFFTATTVTRKRQMLVHTYISRRIKNNLSFQWRDVMETLSVIFLYQLTRINIRDTIQEVLIWVLTGHNELWIYPCRI